jgi:3-methylcrotonyl-CoA carboxylase alpha subunit
MKKIRRLLIANRGEIAVRIIHACREMGISPIAVYSEADRDSPHVSLADESHFIGQASARESYLNTHAILKAANKATADAIHPGYGFLSENAEFAEATAKAGFVFVGPKPSTIKLLGDKSAAKKLMEKAGVPVVPGYHGEDQLNKRIAKEARQIGFPVLIKAAAGGGGRGMRVAANPDEIEPLAHEARQEAKAAFGDDRLLLERYIARPRHIEFQIFGDAQGNICHLFERECSIQRRHQKIIEESPSPLLTPQLRSQMAEAAICAGRAAGYINAGTVEFLVETLADGGQRFYFLEVNTRLQVEHPVTEMIAGLDLVKLQIRIAQGKTLPFKQEDVAIHGHAIEARIYAEDPAAGFLPSVGKIATWIVPQGPGVRLDAGVRLGSDISPYYDPMIGKLIAYGSDRAEAVSRLENSLQELIVLGVSTNIPYLLAIVRHPEFRVGRLSTRFLEEHFSQWKPERHVPNEALLALAAETVTRQSSRSDASLSDADLNNPWDVGGSWRNVR